MTTPSTSSAWRRAAAAAVAIAAVMIACATADARPKKKGKRVMTYDEAVALLKTPAKWCDGAGALGKLGDRRAIAPLYGVVMLAGEGLPDRTCVRDALVTLGVREEALLLVASAEPASRGTGIGMLKAFPADEDVPILTRVALKDTDQKLRMLAARALRTHKTSDAWDTAMIAILDAPDPDVRMLAAGSLERRFGANVLAALKARLAAEPEIRVQTALSGAIKIHEEQAAKNP